MRTLLRYAAFAVLAATLLACDDEQPTQGGSTTTVLTMSTANAEVVQANVWEVWEDTTFPRDNVPDRPRRTFQPDGPIIHVCEPLTGPPAVTRVVDRIPYGFAVEVSILRAGSTQPELVSTTNDQTQRFTGTTLLPSDVPTPVPIPDAGGAPDFLRQGKEMSTADPDYAFRCNGLVIDPNIGHLAGQPTTLLDNPATITLNPGDTLIVQARKAPAAQNPILGDLFPSPSLIGTLSVGGAPVSVSGTAQSTEEDGSGISFSYTLN